MSNTPIISILHPTARVKPYPSFPRGFKAAAEQFAEYAVKPHLIEYILIVHESRWAEFWREYSPFSVAPNKDRVKIDSRTGELWGAFFVVCNHGRDCVVDQINVGAAMATGQLFIGIMDDLVAPVGWDEKLIRLCGPTQDSEHGWHGEYVIDLTGEPQPWIVYSALTRKRYERYGYILHPDFESMYADNYYSDVAQKDGVVINGRGLGFRHDHPSNGRSEMDAVYKSQNDPAKYFRGRNTYARLTGQPLQEAISVCLPGETFQSEWVAMWTELFGHLSQARQMMTLQFFGYTSNVYCTRMALATGVLEAAIESDYVLWIDDDNKLSPAQFDQLLATLKERPELSGVTGWCWCDNHQSEAFALDKWVMSCGKQDGQMKGYRFSPGDLKGLGPVITSDDIAREYGADIGFWSGFPVVLMRGAALRELGAQAFAPIVKPETKFGFTGEDVSFFWHARNAGQKWAVDLRVCVPHMKWRAIEPWVDIPSVPVPSVDSAADLVPVGA